FEQYRQGKDDLPEAGGVLHGKRLKNGSIIITDITTPQIGDIQKRLLFKKNREIHQQLSNEKWIESNKFSIALGEWHTHPEAVPTPSNVDKKSWRLNVSKQHDDRVYVFIIVGFSDLRMWLLSKKSDIRQAIKL
ncbi:Mov34/MPN/PAD-1 family protein, partial [Enterococcus faecium]